MLRQLLVYLAVVIGLVEVVYLLYGFNRYIQASETAVAFEIERGEIARLDEVLTMSARLYAATGDAVWRERYLQSVAPLDRALEQAFALVESDVGSAAVAKVADANRRLIGMEDRALELTAEGQLTKALALLTSESYAEQKAIYQEGLNVALSLSQAHLQRLMEAHRWKLILAAMVLILNLLLVFKLWRRLSLAEQREAAWRTEKALEQQQQRNSLQRTFVSMLSHELRTPLAIIDGKANRLIRRADRLTHDQIGETGLTIRGSVSRLIDLMEGMLNAARLEEGRIEMKTETFDLGARIDEVVAGYRELNQGRRLEVSLDDLPKTVEGDPRLLTQVISNLVSNALKYSAEDSPVRIEGYREGGQVVVAVHDQGVGIPASEIDKLCQRFFRASTSAGVAGTGIGLHFIKHLIDMHDGRLDVRSTEGVGSSFSVYLPDRTFERARPDDMQAAAPLCATLPAH